jgi:hypothetical protein
MRFLKYIGIFILFSFLTLLTQIGGIVLLLCLPIYTFIENRLSLLRIYRLLFRTAIFALLYTIATFWIVPALAKSGGRVPMPYADEHPYLRQHNFYTILFNRHYVVPELRLMAENVADKLNKDATDSLIITYLDCNFPFFDGFPLEPHLSHDDGRKIDFSFQYLDTATKLPTYERPSWLGYGVNEAPHGGEEDYALKCSEEGNWQYSFMSKNIISQRHKHQYPFDATRTKEVLNLFLKDNHGNFILIEPHLKKRLGFENHHKVRRPPCNAVRHDDHYHIAVY